MVDWEAWETQRGSAARPALSRSLLLLLLLLFKQGWLGLLARLRGKERVLGS